MGTRLLLAFGLLAGLFCAEKLQAKEGEMPSAKTYHADSRWGVSLYADFLWWNAKGDQLDYGLVTQGTKDVSSSPTREKLTESFLVYNPKWKPGARVGFRKDFCHQGLGAFAEWTWYHTSDNETTKLTRTDDPNAFLTFNSNFIGGVGGSQTSLLGFETGNIEASFRFLMQRIDAGFYKKFSYKDSLLFRPYAAFTYAYLRENMSLHADFSSPTQGSFFETDRLRIKTKLSGYGLKLGAVGDWKLFPYFSFYTEASLTGILGGFDLNKKFFIEEGGTVSSLSEPVSSCFSDSQTRLIAQIHLSLRCEVPFYRCYKFIGQVGWEQQVLFDQTNWMVRSGQVATLGNVAAANLYLQGLVARIGFYF